jgi:hypothetical protein
LITGGFILGILFSPFMAYGLKEGFRKLVAMKGVKYAGLLLSVGFLTAVWFFTRFLAGFAKLNLTRQSVFWFFLLLGIFIIIKFSYRHSIFNINRDAVLKRKYKRKNL